MKLLRCGRYDGQTFVKPPEVLTRDRLLGMYEVKPALSRLKTTLLGTGGVLLLSGSLLFGIIASSADADGVYGETTAACMILLPALRTVLSRVAMRECMLLLSA